MSNKTMLKYEGTSELDGITYQNTVLLRDTGEETAEAILRTEANYNGKTIFADEVRTDADHEAVEDVLSEIQNYAADPEIGEFNPESVPEPVLNSNYNAPSDIEIPSMRSAKFLNTQGGETENTLVVEGEYVGGEDVESMWENGADNYFSKLVGLEGLDNVYIGANPLIEAIEYEKLPEDAQRLARNLDSQPLIEEHGGIQSAISELAGEDTQFNNEYIVMIRGDNSEDIVTLTNPSDSEVEDFIDTFNPSQTQYLHDGEVDNYFEDQVKELVENFSNGHTVQEVKRNLPEESILSIIDEKENLKTINNMIVSEERINDAEFSIKRALGDNK